MPERGNQPTVMMTIFSAVVLLLLTSPLFAQGGAVRSAPEKRDFTSYQGQLYLLVASNDSSEKGSIPPDLDALVKSIRAELPLSHFRVAASSLIRVKEGGNWEVKGVTSGDWFHSSAPVVDSPVFYEITLMQAKSNGDDSQHPTVHINTFRFSLRVPVVTATAGSGSAVINYEPVGMMTEVSLPEGVPTLVGTMTTGRADQSLIVVISLKRVL